MCLPYYYYYYYYLYTRSVLPSSLLEWTAVITVRMQTLAFFHAKRPVTIPPKSIIIPLSDHVAVLPPPLNHGERKEKSPNCSTTLFGHCNATGTSPILGKVLNWNCIQCRIKASSFKAGCSTLGIRSNDSIKILEPWGRMLFYILLGSVASCLMPRPSFDMGSKFKFFTAPSKRLSLPAQRWSTWFATWPAWSM